MLNPLAGGKFVNLLVQQESFAEAGVGVKTQARRLTYSQQGSKLCLYETGSALQPFDAPQKPVLGLETGHVYVGIGQIAGYLDAGNG
jgi:hypothetical protein